MTKDDFKASADAQGKGDTGAGKSASPAIVTLRAQPQPHLQGPRPPGPKGMPQALQGMPVATAIKVLPPTLQAVKGASAFISKEEVGDEK